MNNTFRRKQNIKRHGKHYGTVEAMVKHFVLLYIKVLVLKSNLILTSNLTIYLIFSQI